MQGLMRERRALAFALIILAAGVLACSACGGSDAPDFTMTASELSAAYEANEVAAGQKYEGKTVRLTGVVSDIGSLGNPRVELVADGSLADVECYCSGGQEDAVSGLAKDGTATIVGEVKGKLGWVIVEDCRIE